MEEMDESLHLAIQHVYLKIMMSSRSKTPPSPSYMAYHCVRIIFMMESSLQHASKFPDHIVCQGVVVRTCTTVYACLNVSST